LYGGLDLHGDNVFCTLMDSARNVRFEQRFPNDLFTILGLAPRLLRLHDLCAHAGVIARHSKAG